jgi:hypothetical protein
MEVIMLKSDSTKGVVLLKGRMQRATEEERVGVFARQQAKSTLEAAKSKPTSQAKKDR